jgi:hypothetical protein
MGQLVPLRLGGRHDEERVRHAAEAVAGGGSVRDVQDGRDASGYVDHTPRGCQIGHADHTVGYAEHTYRLAVVNWCLRPYAIPGLPPLAGVTRLVTRTIRAVIDWMSFAK